jgi:hypothetical protein
MNMTIQMKDALLISNTYNLFTPNSSVIAGGFLRDWDLGRTPKDIDVLIEYQDKTCISEALLLADRLGYTVIDHGEMYPEDGSQNLRLVLRLEKEGHLSIDLIFLNCSVMARIEEFSCALSQIWWDNTLGVVCRKSTYNFSYRNKKLVFSSTLTQEYKERMISYFPDYTVEET